MRDWHSSWSRFRDLKAYIRAPPIRNVGVFLGECAQEFVETRFRCPFSDMVEAKIVVRSER